MTEQKYSDECYLRAGQSYFDGDRDVDIRCHSSRIVTTRKSQFCAVCSKTHRKGKRMFCERAIVDGEWCTSYACCASLEPWIRDTGIDREVMKATVQP